MQHVPYAGRARAECLLGNEVSVIAAHLSSVEEHAKAGRVRLIAAAAEKRAPAMPDLQPSLRWCRAFKTSVWFGLWGGKMPPELVIKIHGDVAKALDLSENEQFFKTTVSNGSISRHANSASSFKAS